MSQYKTGTATVTNGSATVTGSGTLWLAYVTAGDSFTVAGDGVMYDVASVDSDTQVTLSAPYAGTTASGVVYAIGTGYTVPDNFPEMSQGDIETATIFTRAMRKIQSRFTGLVSDISGKAAISGQTFTGDIEASKITASTGILFGTDTAAANTLDDYEEGTWTPSAIWGTQTTAPVITNIKNTSYTKVGRLVTLQGYFAIDFADKGEGIGGLRVLGLPYTGNADFNMGSIWSANIAPLGCFITGNSSSAKVTILEGDSNNLASTDITQKVEVSMCFSYYTAT